MYSHSHKHSLRSAAAPWIACIFFVAAGLAFIPLTGIEADEVLFADAIYQPRAEIYSIRAGSLHIPVMLMTYLGALKTWIYGPILASFGANPRTLRVPMVLAGAASIWLFFLLLRRIAGNRDAVFGCLILAVDSMYLLTSVYDWGPVALQHLLLAGGAFLLVRFYQTQSHRALGWGFFLWGLALWDKALGLWMLSGLGIAAILTFPRQVFAVTTKRRVLISVLAFTLGALPLVIYNVDEHWATFRGNFTRDTAGVPAKLRFLYETAGGNGLFGWLTQENWQTASPHQPRGAMQSASWKIAELADHPRHTFFPYAFALAVLIAPLGGWRALRTVLFAGIALAVAWIQMAINAGTGGSVHHVVLLWPLPHLIVAVSFAAASRRLGRFGVPALAAVAAVLTVSCLLVLNEYYVAAWRHGGGPAWTDAINRLSDSLKKSPAKQVYCMDWGIMDQLRFLQAGKLPLGWGGDLPSNARDLQGALAAPEHVFVAHTKPFAFYPESAEKLTKAAEEASYRRELLETVPDNYGRAVYEVYRFVK